MRDLFRELTAVAGELEARDLAHFDFSSGNIFVELNGKKLGRVRLVDFGNAERLSDLPQLNEKSKRQWLPVTLKVGDIRRVEGIYSPWSDYVSAANLLLF